MYPLSSVALPRPSFSLHRLFFFHRLPSQPLSLSAATPPPSFLLRLLLLHRPLLRAPSSSVGVNLSPRLSPNPELYKLKPISLPGLRSSYSGPLYFRLFVVGKHAWSSSQQRATSNEQRASAFRSHTLLHHHKGQRIHQHPAPLNLCAIPFLFACTQAAVPLLCTTMCVSESLIRRCGCTHLAPVHARIFTCSSLHGLHESHGTKTFHFSSRILVNLKYTQVLSPANRGYADRSSFWNE